MDSPDFFVTKKVSNRAAADTYIFDPVLFQFCVRIALIIFTENSDLNKSVQEILPETYNNGERHFFV